MATAVVENATVRDGCVSGEEGCGRRWAARGRRAGLCRVWRRGRERRRRRNRFVRMGSAVGLSWLLMLAPAGGAMSNPGARARESDSKLLDRVSHASARSVPPANKSHKIMHIATPYVKNTAARTAPRPPARRPRTAAALPGAAPTPARALMT